MRADGCVSTWVFHSRVPFCASSAYTGAAVVAEECGARRLDDVEMRQGALQLARQGHHPRARQFADGHRRAAARGGVIGPIGAAGLGVERVDAARGTRDEQPLVHDGGLAEFRAASGSNRTPISVRASPHRWRESRARAGSAYCRGRGPSHSIARCREQPAPGGSSDRRYRANGRIGSAAQAAAPRSALAYLRELAPPSISAYRSAGSLAAWDRCRAGAAGRFFMCGSETISCHCATQPAVRAMANITVNMERGMPSAL